MVHAVAVDSVPALPASASAVVGVNLQCQQYVYNGPDRRFTRPDERSELCQPETGEVCTRWCAHMPVHMAILF